MSAKVEPAAMGEDDVAVSDRSELADMSTLKDVRRVIESGILPTLKISDMEDITMDYAKGVIWLAGEEIAENTLINSKQRTRLRKLMSKGFIKTISEAELSVMSSHEAEVMIERGSRQRAGNISDSTRDGKVTRRGEQK